MKGLFPKRLTTYIEIWHSRHTFFSTYNFVRVPRSKTYFVTYLRDLVLQILSFSWYFGRRSWFFGGCSGFSGECSWFSGGVPGFLGGVPGFFGCSGMLGVPVFLEVLHAKRKRCHPKSDFLL